MAEQKPKKKITAAKVEGSDIETPTASHDDVPAAVPVAQNTSQAASPQESRVFKGQKKLHSDRYKLLVSNMVINKGIQGQEQDTDFINAEHCHFFHTVSSSGRTHTNSSPIGGHFHVMKVTPQGPGQPPKVECVSGPMKFVNKKVKGRLQKVAVPVNNYDNHTHDVQYIDSMEVAQRQTNIEAVKVQTHMAQKEAPVPGVQG